MRYRKELWSVFLRCEKMFSLRSLSIPDVSSLSISSVVFLTSYTTKCDDVSSYTSCLSTVQKTWMTLWGDPTITMDEVFLILKMTQFQSGDKLQKKVYNNRNTFKILEKNVSDTTLGKNVINEIRKDTLCSSTRTLKVLKVDLMKDKGTKCADYYGYPTHCGLPQGYLEWVSIPLIIHALMRFMSLWNKPLKSRYTRLMRIKMIIRTSKERCDRVMTTRFQREEREGD